MGERVPFDELKALPEFEILTTAQQIFVEAYIANGYDSTKAAQSAYRCKNEASARVLGINVLKSYTVMLIMSVHYHEDPKEAFLRMCVRMLAKGKITAAQLELIRIICRVRGYYVPGASKYPSLLNAAGDEMTLTEAGLSARGNERQRLQRRTHARRKARAERVVEVQNARQDMESSDGLDEYRKM